MKKAGRCRSSARFCTSILVKNSALTGMVVPGMMPATTGSPWAAGVAEASRYSVDRFAFVVSDVKNHRCDNRNGTESTSNIRKLNLEWTKNLIFLSKIL